jgi:hypothetical protein
VIQQKSNFKGTARNFNPCMSGAAKITVAEGRISGSRNADPIKFIFLEYLCNAFFKVQNMKKNRATYSKK